MTEIIKHFQKSIVPTIDQPPPLHPDSLAAHIIYDHGASHTSIRTSDSPHLPLRNYTTQPPHRELYFPNGHSITAIGAAQLPVGPLTIPTDIYHDNDLSDSLFAVGQATARGCESHETDTIATLTLNGHPILRADKHPDSPHWTVPLDRFSPSPPTASAAMTHIPKSQSAHDRTLWCHASLGSPTLFLLQRAFDRHYFEYPWVTASDIRRYRPHTPATDKGHMAAQRQGYMSTKPLPPSPSPSTTLDPFPSPPLDTSDDTADPADDTGYSLLMHGTDIIHGDATGQFPVASSGGHKYILIMYYKGYIKLLPLKDKTGAEYARAYQEGIALFTSHGHTPSWIRLDN